MRKNLIAFGISFLMIFISLNSALPSMNDELFDEETKRVEAASASELINIPGFQAGSIFSDTVMSSGDDHTCIITTSEKVKCWGKGDLGQLGNGGTNDKDEPTRVSNFDDGKHAVALSSSGFYTCALLNDGSVSCWGNQMTDSTSGVRTGTLVPSHIGDFDEGRFAVEISVGHGHGCAILNDGLVSCWGYGYEGTLGDGNMNQMPNAVAGPTPTTTLGEGRTAVAIESGAWHTCVILDNGKVSCWGKNDNGQLGHDQGQNMNSNEDVKNPNPTPTANLGVSKRAVALSAGNKHTCAILDDGLVLCWGYFSNSQLEKTSESNIMDYWSPTAVVLDGNEVSATTITSGIDYSCAITEINSVICWGGMAASQSNVDKFRGQASYAVSDLKPNSITAGSKHACVIAEDSSVYCWGGNNKGQLAASGATALVGGQLGFFGNTVNIQPMISERDNDGDNRLNIFDTHISLDNKEVTISAGEEHTCVILNTGNVSCWGEGNYGRLGVGETFVQNSVPTPVNSLGEGRTAIDIASGKMHTCVILDTGNVSCWGYNSDGQLGNGGYENTNAPSASLSFLNNRRAVEISSGNFHTCVILDDGQLACWGNNYNGQLGLVGEKFPTPQIIDLPENKTAIAISLASSSTCAILNDGSVKCWGNNVAGHFTDLGGNRKAIAISANNGHACILLDDGKVKCWGIGNYYRLGNGDSSDQTSPTSTYNLQERAIAISAGGYSTCVILESGRISCWGNNAKGQIGNNGISGNDVRYPTYAVEIENKTPVAISSGLRHVCIVVDTGEIACWGEGLEGKLGNGQLTNLNLPTLIGSVDIVSTVDGDTDGDGVLDVIDAYPNNPILTITCPAGSYGRFSCAESPPGSYIDEPNQMLSSSAVKCDLGTYQELGGQTSCVEADAGYFVGSRGATSQTACQIGTYQDERAQSTCKVAEFGYYVDSQSATEQQSCPINHVTLGNGSIEETNCLFDFDSDLIADDFDDDDDNDGVLDLYDQCGVWADYSLGWFSDSTTDYDSDGCLDDSWDDLDDDNDGIPDEADGCPKGELYWTSSSSNDDDGDGCYDANEDLDDDGNGVKDSEQFMLSGEGAAYTWTRIGICAGVILFLIIGAISIKRKKKHTAESVLDMPAEKEKLEPTIEEDYGQDQVPHTPIELEAEQQQLAPSADTPAQQIDAEKGYEWYSDSNGNHWYRIIGSNSEWLYFES